MAWFGLLFSAHLMLLSYVSQCAAQSYMGACVTYTNSQLPAPTLDDWRLMGHVFLRMDVPSIGGDYW